LKDEPFVLEFFEKAWKNENLDETVETVLSNFSLWGMDLNQIEGFKSKIISSFEIKTE